MMNGGEAADQMVSYAFKGGEVVLRLSGSAAKNLAVYLANILKEGGPSKGKTTLKRMIADGSPLTVQRIKVDEIPYFNEMAKKYGVMFVAIRDKQRADGTCDIMFRADDAARVNRIFDTGDPARISIRSGSSPAEPGTTLPRQSCLTAISEHPDVAHIRSEIQRERGENQQEHGVGGNPTRTARERTPSGRPSPVREAGSNELPSVRAQLRELRNARLAGDAQPSAPTRAPRAPLPRTNNQTR